MTSSTNPFPAPNIDHGTAYTESSGPSLPMRLTLKSSASTFANVNHSPYNDDLLTPPLSNPSLDEPPFRPSESDRTSLSMKRRHGSPRLRCRRHNRACVSSGDVDQRALLQNDSSSLLRSISRSKSAPNLTELLQVAFRKNDTRNQGTWHLAKNSTYEGELASRRDSSIKHIRRWTIPGKAAPTRVLTSVSPSAVLAEHSKTPNNDDGESVDRAMTVETPAMITLQRAASGQSRRTSLRPEAYTSFPVPTFSNTRSGFVTTFFGDDWQRSDTTFVHASIESVSIAPQHYSSRPNSNRASVDSGNAHPSHSTTAGPVFTDVILDPVIQSQMKEVHPAIRQRRCSTKYVSGASTYEVIWDENVSTSGGSRRTSGEQTRRISMRDNDIVPERKQSLAVDKLETQLLKGIQQSRRASSASKELGTIAKGPRTRRSTNRKSFHNMLNFQQAEYDAKEAQESLPRSRASTTSTQKLIGPDMEVYLTTITGNEISVRNRDFFPPLSSSPNSLDASNDSLLANPWRSSWQTEGNAVTASPIRKVDVPVPSSQPRGSMIGQGTGLRKISVQRERNGQYRKSGITIRTRTGTVEDDQKPLLGQFDQWPNEAFYEGYDD